MALPENQTYNNISQGFKPFFNKAYQLGNTLPKRQAAPGLSKYQGLANTASRRSGPGQIAGLGAVTTQYGGGTRYERSHPGIDIANTIGTNIPAFTAGKVTDVVTGKRQGDKGYGNYVIVTDGTGNKHRYSHLNQSFVKIGDNINRGQNVGTMGNSGQTYSLHGGTGSHLDYRIMDLYGKYIDPLRFINA